MNPDAGQDNHAYLETLADTPPWEWPEGANDVLLQVLRDPQAGEADRVQAAELAGDLVVINDELVDTLLGALRNDADPEELRCWAAISLGPVLEYADAEGFVDPEEMPITEKALQRILETFRAQYADESVPKHVRRRILEAGVRCPQDWHREAVRSAYASDDDWKLTGVFSMGYVQGFEDQILESLDSPDPWMRYHAITAAGNWQLDAAWPKVAGLLTTPDPEKDLLIAALEAAAGIRPDEALPLLEPFRDSKDEDIAEAAEEAIALAEDFLAEEEGSEEEEEEEEGPSR